MGEGRLGRLDRGTSERVEQKAHGVYFATLPSLPSRRSYIAIKVHDAHENMFVMAMDTIAQGSPRCREGSGGSLVP